MLQLMAMDTHVLTEMIAEGQDHEMHREVVTHYGVTVVTYAHQQEASIMEANAQTCTSRHHQTKILCA
jgi:hypothetical protein